MKHFLLFVLVINSLITRGQLTPKSVRSDKGVIGFYEFKPLGYKADSSYNYPLMIFLHGIGERGNGTSELPMALNSSFAKILAKGATMKFVVNGVQHAFLVLLPQMSKEYENWQNFYVDQMIDYAKRNLKIDTNKIFVTGWSLGGGGAWKYATASVENASRLAGIIPVAPAPDYTDLCNLARGKVAVWAHHARDDASVPLHYTEDAITAINACSPTIRAMITYYPFGGHPYVADQAYDTLNEIQYPNVFQWMIGTSRANTAETNKAPLAIAGQDTTIVLSSTSAVLNGRASYDPNDIIVRYDWSLVSGPPSPFLRIVRHDYPVTQVTGLEAGDYIFRLTVKDEFGVSRSDEMTIKVTLPPDGSNARPVVAAGEDISITSDTYYITGKGRDFDGTLKNYHWRQISGPLPITIVSQDESASLLGMSKEGVYGIELTGWDNNSPAGTGKDTVFITRDAPPPVYFTAYSTINSNAVDQNLTRYGPAPGLTICGFLILLIVNVFVFVNLIPTRFNHLLVTRAFVSSRHF